MWLAWAPDPRNHSRWPSAFRQSVIASLSVQCSRGKTQASALSLELWCHALEFLASDFRPSRHYSDPVTPRVWGGQLARPCDLLITPDECLAVLEETKTLQILGKDGRTLRAVKLPPPMDIRGAWAPRQAVSSPSGILWVLNVDKALYRRVREEDVFLFRGFPYLTVSSIYPPRDDRRLLVTDCHAKICKVPLHDPTWPSPLYSIWNSDGEADESTHAIAERPSDGKIVFWDLRSNHVKWMGADGSDQVTIPCQMPDDFLPSSIAIDAADNIVLMGANLDGSAIVVFPPDGGNAIWRTNVDAKLERVLVAHDGTIAAMDREGRCVRLF